MSSHLNKSDLDELRLALARERAKLHAAVDARQSQGRGVTDNEIEDGDVAERMIVQDDALQLNSFDANLLADIDRAIGKMEAGTYGVSEVSGKPIPLDRLRAVPWARRTLEEEERRH